MAQTEKDTDQPLFLAKTSETIQHKFFSEQIVLNPKITKFNFFCFLLYTAFPGLVLIPAGFQQASVLGVVYKLNTDEQASIMSVVQLIQLILQLLIAPWIGYFCDKYGRKTPISIGLIGVCMTIFITTHLPNPYPYYIITLCLQAVLSMTFIIPPLLADYIDRSTHGRMAGLASVLVNAGSSFVTALSTSEDTEENLRKRFFYLGITASVLAIIILLGLKGDSHHRDLIKTKSFVQECTSLNEDNEDNTTLPTKQAQPGFIAGIKEAKNPWILIGYLLGFLMMSSTGLTSFALVTLVIQLTHDKTKAYLAYALDSKFLMTATICSIFFGFFADKYNKFKLVTWTIISSIISIVLLILMTSPTEPMAVIAMVFFGVAVAGFSTLGTQLLNKYASAQLRGSVLACGGMISLSAGATINILGVYLIHWNVLIPFFMYFGYSVIAFVIILILYILKKEVLNQT